MLFYRFLFLALHMLFDGFFEILDLFFLHGSRALHHFLHVFKTLLLLVHGSLDAFLNIVHASFNAFLDLSSELLPFGFFIMNNNNQLRTYSIFDRLSNANLLPSSSTGYW